VSLRFCFDVQAGTKVTFENEGDEYPGVIPADIIFVLEEKPHPYFVRQGNDLIYTAEITLLQVLTRSHSLFLS
jgi:DnaJ family protein B protein 4